MLYATSPLYTETDECPALHRFYSFFLYPTFFPNTKIGMTQLLLPSIHFSQFFLIHLVFGPHLELLINYSWLWDQGLIFLMVLWNYMQYWGLNPVNHMQGKCPTYYIIPPIPYHFIFLLIYIPQISENLSGNKNMHIYFQINNFSLRDRCEK